MPQYLFPNWPPLMAVFFNRYPHWLPAVHEPIPLGWDIDIVGALTRLEGLQYEALVRLTLAVVGARNGDLHLDVSIADASPATAEILLQAAGESHFRSRTLPGTLTEKIDEIRSDAVQSAARWCVTCPALATRRIGVWRFCDRHDTLDGNPR